MRLLSFIAFAGMTAIAAGAQSATIYDEGVSGDASSAVSTGTDLGILATEATSTVLGSYDAGPSGSSNGPDEQDSYRFEALASFTVDAFTTAGDDARYLLYAIPVAFQASSDPGIDMFGNFGPGTYSLALIGNSNAGAGGYQIDINVGDIAAIPLPAAAWLFGSALLGLGAIKRKKV